MAPKKEFENQSPMPVWRKRLRRHLPITRWLPTYTKFDLVSDFIAGFTLGLTMIPQSIAYAALAGLPPQYGLYSSFMGSFVYAFLGTIKEVSIGTTSLMALLTFEFTEDLPYDFTNLLTFLSGCIVLLMGLFRFGFLIDFISAPVITGFQSATATIIITSQLKGLLGLRKVKAGTFVDNMHLMWLKWRETQLGDAALGFCCCALLLSLRMLKDVRVGRGQDPPTARHRVANKALWFISISRNALVVLMACVTAYVFESTNDEVPFVLSGEIRSGLPALQLPAFTTQIGNVTYTFPDMCAEIGFGILVIPLVAVLANVSIAKAFASGATVDATQEMVSLGVCNIAGSLVGSLPTCGAFTRSAVSNSSGVRTPLAGIFSGSLILLVLTLLTPYFYYIPRATLAAVLICAVVFMIDWKTMMLLWRANKRDFFCSMATFLACLGLGVEVGLMVGIAINIGQLLYLWARPSISIQVKEVSNGQYYLVTPDIGLFFPAVDFLRNELGKHCPRKLPVVVDCLHFKGIDYTTAQGISEMVRDYQRLGRKLLLVNMNPRIYESLKEANIDLIAKQCTSCEEELNGILFNPAIRESPSALLLSDLVADEHNTSKQHNGGVSSLAEQKSLL